MSLRQGSPIITIFITVFIDLLGVGIVLPIIAPLLIGENSQVLSSSISIETKTIILGFLIASFPIAQFFGAPILGALSDRYGRKKLLALSITGTVIGYMLFAYAILNQNIYLLFISRAIDGFSGGNISIVLASISDHSDANSKAKNFGLVGAAFGLGFILGPFIGGILADPNNVSWFNMATPFWFTAILASINLIFVLFMFPETLKSTKTTSISFFTGINNISKAFKQQNLRTIFIVVFLFTLGFNFFTQFFHVFLINKFDFSITEIANIFAYIGIWIVITQGGIQRIVSAKFNSAKIVPVSALLLGLTFPVILFLDHSKYLFFVLPFIAIFQGINNPNIISLVSSQANKKSQGQILGINQSIQSLGTLIPPIVAGFISSININLPIASASFFILLGWLTFIVFFKKTQTE